MAAQYITQAYVEGRLTGSDTAAWVVDRDLTSMIEGASASAASLLARNGYRVDNPDDAPELVKNITLVFLVYELYAVRGLAVPDAWKARFGTDFAAIRSGDMEVPGLTANASTAVGGSRWSPTRGSKGRPAVMRDLHKVR